MGIPLDAAILAVGAAESGGPFELWDVHVAAVRIASLAQWGMVLGFGVAAHIGLSTAEITATATACGYTADANLLEDVREFERTVLEVRNRKP